jgi:hypothetical protein
MSNIKTGDKVLYKNYAYPEYTVDYIGELMATIYCDPLPNGEKYHYQVHIDELTLVEESSLKK